ncbi:replication-relaxation family protein [Dactylosporangium cerinum]|uniref:Replication-relaxation family protein n=1 Tax=Dactylosporangium cerinum TaxID=1434730 RepID=A0ABV9WB15_9ACTN
MRADARAGRADPLAVFRRIVPRDRALLALLAEHYLLSSTQIAAAFFDSRRIAQRRLTVLHRLGAVHRFAYPNAANTAVPYLYTLGPVGLQLHPDAYHDPDGRHAKTPRTSLERARRIAASATATHLLGVNQFFIDLIAATRLPNTAGAQLVRWWSEQHATDVYAQSGIRPDGHGIWHAHEHTVGFFLEHDRGTEDLPRVVAKLRAYARLTEFGPRYPVLLWLPTPQREANILRLLAGVHTPMPVATAVHGPDPAGRVWTLATDLPASPGRRRRLHELPSDHGPRSGTNPGHYDD